MLLAQSTFDCPARRSIATQTVTDAWYSDRCSSDADATTPGSCAGKYSVTRTWTAKDACGNSSTASQTVNVTDTAAPAISALPPPCTIECPASPSFATPTATDACDPSPSLTSAGSEERRVGTG